MPRTSFRTQKMLQKSKNALFHETLRLALVAIAAGLCTKTIVFLYWDWEHLAQAAAGVIEGKPHWRAYQNRLLGPYVVQALTFFGPPYKIALLLVTALILMIHHLILYACLRRVPVAPWASVLLVFTWSFIFVAFLDRRWFYIWDVIDLVVFTPVAFLIVFSQRPALIMLGFPVALLNRESALFLPVAYMIREGMRCIAHRATFSDLRLVAWKLVAASGLVIGGALYTKYIRDALFVEQLSGGIDAANALLGNHFYLVSNVRGLLFSNFKSVYGIFSLTIVIACAYMAHVFAATRDEKVRAGVIFFVLLVNILAFGMITETRMLFPLISLTMFIMLAHIRSAHGEEARLFASPRATDGIPLTPSAANPP